MRPDLFAGSALRDDSHRILARLAHGGSVPAPARQWGNRDMPQRYQLAAVVALFVLIAATWAWLQDEGAPAPPPRPAARSAPPLMPAYVSPPQAATIVNEAPRPAAPAPAAVPPAAPPSTARIEAHTARPRAARPAQRGQASAPAMESDEDVTLLTAMLRHGKQQKAPAIVPKD